MSVVKPENGQTEATTSKIITHNQLTRYKQEKIGITCRRV